MDPHSIFGGIPGMDKGIGSEQDTAKALPFANILAAMCKGMEGLWNCIQLPSGFPNLVPPVKLFDKIHGLFGNSKGK